MTLLKSLTFLIILITGVNTFAQSPSSQLIGDWIGEGYAEGFQIKDSISFSPVEFSENHIRFKLNEIGGSLAMEGFLYEGENMQFTLYEFNNGKWPNRVFTGKYETDRFSLIEHTPERKILLEIIIIDENSFQMRETVLQGIMENNLIVDELFHRLAVKK